MEIFYIAPDFVANVTVAVVHQVAHVDQAIFVFVAARTGHFWDIDTHNDKVGVRIVFQFLVPSSEFLEEIFVVSILFHFSYQRFVKFVRLA